MRADQRKFHYIYKITRTDGSGKFYIGMHSTDDLDDGYFGSGTQLAHSIRRHGKEKHRKEILEHLPSRITLRAREKELVNEDLLGDTLCMNLKLGGEGGGKFKDKNHQLMCAAAGGKEGGKVAGKLNGANNIKKARADGKYVGCDWTGRKHSPATIEKMRASQKAASLRRKEALKVLESW